MSTHEMQELAYMRRPGVTGHVAQVPGFGEVMVLVTTDGLLLTLPDQAVTTSQDLAAIRRDLGEVRDRLRVQAQASASSRRRPQAAGVR